MELKHIFGPDGKKPPDTYLGLWAVVYQKGGNCFTRFRSYCENPLEIFNFCQEHIEDLRKVENFGPRITPSTAAAYLMEEFEALMEELKAVSESTEVAENLQSIFIPYYPKDSRIHILQCSKAKLLERTNKLISPKIRLYAIRIDENTYVLTGGAIKLTDQMKERDHTIEEDKNIKKVLNWLKEENVEYPEDLLNLKS